MNRAPSKNDIWWAEHQRTCGGTYTKIKEPEGYGQKKSKGEKEEKSKGEKSKGKGVKSMDIRIFGGEGKILGKPKISGSGNSGTKTGTSIPTATITSGVLSRQGDNGKTDAGKDNVDSNSGSGHVTKAKRNNESGLVTNTNSNKDSNVAANKKDSDSLPGASTPTKAVKNKPVSQGGNVPFSKVKKKVFTVLDFSDSDDDDDDEDLLTAVSQIETGIWSNSKTETESAASGDKNSFVSVDKINTVQKIHTDTGKDNSVKNIDTNDVRAMLRKVWGQKQVGQNKLLTSQVLKDNNDKTEGQKRGLANIDSNPVCKRIKLTNDEKEIITKHDAGSSSNVMSKVAHDDDTSLPHVPSKHTYHNHTGQHTAGSTIPKVTSPIEKLFNKIKNKENNLSKESSGLNEAVIAQNASDRETTNTVINSDNTHTDTETSVCPVCCQSVPMSSINDHLDLCLTLKAIA